MKKILICTIICFSLLLTACKGGGPGNTLPAGTTEDNGSQTIVTGMADENQQFTDTAEAATDAPETESAALENTGENSAEEDMVAMPQITVSVGETVYQARLYDNEAARELEGRMPLELEMEELNGNEKFNYLSESLPTDAETIGSIHTGDIMLYGSDCLVLFYEDFQTPYSYTRIGYLEEPAGLSDALGSGSASVSFNQAE